MEYESSVKDLFVCLPFLQLVALKSNRESVLAWEGVAQCPAYRVDNQCILVCNRRQAKLFPDNSCEVCIRVFGMFTNFNCLPIIYQYFFSWCTILTARCNKQMLLNYTLSSRPKWHFYFSIALCFGSTKKHCLYNGGKARS